MIKLVLSTTQSAFSPGQSLLLDGFPRTLSQAQSLDNKLIINHVINICIPNEIIVERISDRWIHPASGRVYSYSYRPPKVYGMDDETGEPLVQRDDEKPASVFRRLEKYEEATRPLVDYYRERGGVADF
jgi:adenylate kinase family enzyme